MITLKNINKSYGDIVVFKDFNIQLQQDKITCVLGKSGCGKTTLLNILAGVTAYDGQISGFDGKVSYIFQRERLLPNLTVRQNLQYVLKKDHYDKIDGMLSALEISDKADCYPSQLSGGQAQRVSVARAFLFDSQLLLMDEPFGSLDTALKIRLIDAFFKVLNNRKRTVLFVTHDAEEACMLADRVVLLNDGKIAFDHTFPDAPPRKYGSDSVDKRLIIDNLLKL